jgi:peroxiredoxin
LALVADVDGPLDGPTIVLLHGGGQTRHSWAGTWKLLVQEGWRAWSVDLRGHGDSAWAPDGDYSLEAFASDVAAISASIPQPPVLVGASLGGISSLVAVAEAPVQEEMARALVLVDVAHRLEEDGRDRIGAFMRGNLEGFASLDEAADVIAAYNPHRPRPSDLSGLAKNLRRRDDRWYWHWDPEFIGGTADLPPSEISDIDRLDQAVEAIVEGGTPLMLLRGRASDLVSEEKAAAFCARHPAVEFRDISGAGHMVAGDRNDAFTEAVLDFLDRHRP